MGSNKISTIDLEEPVVEALNTIDTVADQVSTVDSNVNSIKSTVEDTSIKMNDMGDSLATVNTNVNNLNTRLTDTRASNLDLLADGTNGLAALKTAINSVNTAVSNSGGGYYYYKYGTTETLATGTMASREFTYSNSAQTILSDFIVPADGTYRVDVVVNITKASSGYSFGPKINYPASPFYSTYTSNVTVASDYELVAGTKTFTGKVYLLKGMQVNLLIGWVGSPGTSASVIMSVTSATIKGTKVNL